MQACLETLSSGRCVYTSNLLTCDTGVTTYSALRRSNLRAGQWLVISGAGGGLGHIAVQLATKGFAFRVIGIDLASKKDLIMESGAEHFLDATLDSAELVKQTKALTGGL